MKKKDLKKMALMGLTAGALLSSQSTVQADENNYANMMAANCGGKHGCGGMTAYNPPPNSKFGYYRNDAEIPTTYYDNREAQWPGAPVQQHPAQWQGQTPQGQWQNQPGSTSNFRTTPQPHPYQSAGCGAAPMAKGGMMAGCGAAPMAQGNMMAGCGAQRPAQGQAYPASTGQPSGQPSGAYTRWEQGSYTADNARRTNGYSSSSIDYNPTTGTYDSMNQGPMSTQPGYNPSQSMQPDAQPRYKQVNPQQANPMTPRGN